jgi:4-hydroxybenzoate polyprenyltransferase
MLRLVHPFPSILDGVVVALVAWVAGGSPWVAAQLGGSMVLLQFAIGALNDVVDAPTDSGHKRGKPIPAGFVTPQTAVWVAIGCAAGGLALAVARGPVPGGLAVAGLAIGAAYDLKAKGTALSWLPFAIGIPLLPVFGWFGAAGRLPGAFLVLVPAAAIAGTALAIANTSADMERDVAAGTRSVAVMLGRRRAAILVAILHSVVAVVVVASAAIFGASAGWLAAILVAVAVVGSGAALGVAAARRAAAAVGERAWEVQAVGTGLLAVAWLGALASAGGGLAGR